MELKGKRVAFLGDSITEGTGTLKVGERYEDLLYESCEFSEIYINAIAGSRIAYQHRPTQDARRQLFFCGRAFFLPTEADMVIVYGGTNDYLSGDAPIGEEGDDSIMTFRGAVRFLMSTLRERFGGKPIVFLTPAHLHYKGVSDADTKSRYDYAEDRPMPLTGYIEIIEKTAKDFGIYTFNLYENLGIDPNNPADREKYTFEGLHFNQEGHKVIARKVEEYLRSI